MKRLTRHDVDIMPPSRHVSAVELETSIGRKNQECFKLAAHDENGDVVVARQVSIRPEKIHEFFMKLTRERLQ